MAGLTIIMLARNTGMWPSGAGKAQKEKGEEEKEKDKMANTWKGSE
jgi:hypothetical protein